MAASGIKSINQEEEEILCSSPPAVVNGAHPAFLLVFFCCASTPTYVDGRAAFLITAYRWDVDNAAITAPRYLRHRSIAHHQRQYLLLPRIGSPVPAAVALSFSTCPALLFLPGRMVAGRVFVPAFVIVPRAAISRNSAWRVWRCCDNSMAG